MKQKKNMHTQPKLQQQQRVRTKSAKLFDKETIEMAANLSFVNMAILSECTTDQAEDGKKLKFVTETIPKSE